MLVAMVVAGPLVRCEPERSPPPPTVAESTGTVTEMRSEYDHKNRPSSCTLIVKLDDQILYGQARGGWGHRDIVTSCVGLKTGDPVKVVTKTYHDGKVILSWDGKITLSSSL